MGVLIAIVLIIGAWIAWGVYKRNLAEQRMKAAWNQYQMALANMHYDPMARAAVVNLGRIYYGMRRGGAVTVYDEMARWDARGLAGGGARRGRSIRRGRRRAHRGRRRTPS